MKKIINAPETYVDDMLKGIYAAHPDQVKCAEDDLRSYCIAHKKDGKVAIITGGGSGHLPLFLGYVGEGLIDGCFSLRHQNRFIRLQKRFMQEQEFFSFMVIIPEIL